MRVNELSPLGAVNTQKFSNNFSYFPSFLPTNKYESKITKASSHRLALLPTTCVGYTSLLNEVNEGTETPDPGETSAKPHAGVQGAFLLSVTLRDFWEN